MTEVVDNALLSGHSAVKEVSGINLHARLVGILLQDDAGLGAV